MSRNLFTSSGDDLGTRFVPNRNRIDRAGIARAQKLLSCSCLGSQENGYTHFIEDKRRGRFRNAVAEADAERPIDPYAQLAHAPFFEIAHMPSRPSSARAVSITAGVISVMPRSLA